VAPGSGKAEAMPAPKWHLPICALYLYSSEHRPGNAAHATNANQRPRRVRRRREPTPDGRQRQAPHVGDERPATRLPAALDSGSGRIQSCVRSGKKENFRDSLFYFSFNYIFSVFHGTECSEC